MLNGTHLKTLELVGWFPHVPSQLKAKPMTQEGFQEFPGVVHPPEYPPSFPAETSH